jgi:hypothetical protein
MILSLFYLQSIKTKQFKFKYILLILYTKGKKKEF